MEYIRSYVAKDWKDWDHWLKYATFAHNTTPQSSTNYMSFQLLYGRLPNLPGHLQQTPRSEFYAYDNYITELEARLQISYAMARSNLETAKLNNKEIMIVLSMYQISQ
jgi:hypothetical protein